MNYNGCSVLFGLDFIYKSIFKYVCNKYDVCYYCVRKIYCIFFKGIIFVRVWGEWDVLLYCCSVVNCFFFEFEKFYIDICKKV